LEIVKQVKSNWGRGTPSVLSARQTKMTSVSRSELSVPRQASTDSLSHLSPRQPSTDSTSHLSPRLVPTPIARKLSFTQEEQPRNIPPPVLPRKRCKIQKYKKLIYDS